MKLEDLESLFSRTWIYAFSQTKLLLTFSVLMLCGLVVVAARSLAVDAGHWMILSLTFLPFFLSTGLLLSLGIILIRVYHQENKQQTVSYREVLLQSWHLIVNTSYLTLPLLLLYLVFWVILGFFFLLKALPAVGAFLSVIVSFAPFLLILGSFILCLLNVALLFYITPALALEKDAGVKIWKKLFLQFKGRLFTNLLLIVIASFPLLFVSALLILAAYMTESHYLVSTDALSIGLQWFFIMVPFNALLTPFIIFFFNFSTEAHQLLQSQIEET